MTRRPNNKQLYAKDLAELIDSLTLRDVCPRPLKVVPCR
jgi:hypothetical protein